MREGRREWRGEGGGGGSGSGNEETAIQAEIPSGRSRGAIALRTHEGARGAERVRERAGKGEGGGGRDTGGKFVYPVPTRADGEQSAPITSPRLHSRRSGSLLLLLPSARYRTRVSVITARSSAGCRAGNAFISRGSLSRDSRYVEADSEGPASNNDEWVAQRSREGKMHAGA